MNRQKRKVVNLAILGIVVLLTFLFTTIKTSKLKKELDLANAKSIYYAAQAQQVASAAELTDADGNVYPALFVDGKYQIHKDFWDGELPKKCSFIINEEGMKAACNGTIFQRKQEVKAEEELDSEE